MVKVNVILLCAAMFYYIDLLLTCLSHMHMLHCMMEQARTQGGFEGVRTNPPFGRP